MICRELAGSLRLAVVTNDIYTDEDARFLRSAGVLARGADRRGRDRRLPAHRDPRRRHRQPDGGRGPRAAVRPARRRPRRVRRRQPHRDLLARARRRPDLRARRGRRWRRGPQGRPGHRAGGPAGREQDRPRAVRRRGRRPDGPRRRARPRRPARAGAVPHRPRLGGGAVGLGHRTAGHVPQRLAGPRRPRPDGGACPTHMLTATRTEVRSSHLRAFALGGGTSRAGARAGGAAGRRPRDRGCPGGCRAAAGDRRAGRHRRLRDARQAGPLGRAGRGRGRWEPGLARRAVRGGRGRRRPAAPTVELAPASRVVAPGDARPGALRRAAGPAGGPRPTSIATACRCWWRSWTPRSGWARTGCSTRCWIALGGQRDLAAADRPMVLESGDLLHRWLGAETHASPIWPRVSRPRATSRRPLRGVRRRTTSRAVSRSGPSPAASATWPARSRSCFIQRTKSPAASSTTLSTSSSSSPSAQR